MTRIARNVTMADDGLLASSPYLLHDRDGKSCPAFVNTVESVRVKSVKLPARNPDLNAFAERRVRSVKEEYLSKMIFLGEDSLPLALTKHQRHYREERPHRGGENVILFPESEDRDQAGPARCQERLGGLLKYYHRKAGWASSAVRPLNVHIAFAPESLPPAAVKMEKQPW